MHHGFHCNIHTYQADDLKSNVPILVPHVHHSLSICYLPQVIYHKLPGYLVKLRHYAIQVANKVKRLYKMFLADKKGNMTYFLEKEGSNNLLRCFHSSYSVRVSRPLGTILERHCTVVMTMTPLCYQEVSPLTKQIVETFHFSLGYTARGHLL